MSDEIKNSLEIEGLDDNQEEELQEDYPLSPVPPFARKSIVSLLFVLMGFTLYSGTLFGGGAVGSAFNFKEMLLIVFLGNLILGTYAALLGWIAAKSGLSTVLMARYGFGNIGSRLVDFIFAFTQIGWYAWGTALIVKLLNKLAGVPESYNIAIMIFFTFSFCITAYIGYRGLDWLSRVAVPAMFILIGISLYIGLGDANGLEGLLAIVPKKELGFGAAITIIVGTFISGGTQATNWSRFAKSPVSAFVGTLVAFLIGNGILSFTGAFGALVYNNHDIVEVMAQQGLMTMGIVLLFFNMWTTQDNTIYNFSVAGTNMFRSHNRHAFVIGGAFVSLFLAIGGIYNYLIGFMILLGTFIPPIGGVIMANFWLEFKGEYPQLESWKENFNWSGLAAYFIGSGVAYFAPGMKPVYGVVAAFLSYLLMLKIFNAKNTGQNKEQPSY